MWIVAYDIAVAPKQRFGQKVKAFSNGKKIITHLNSVGDDFSSGSHRQNGIRVQFPPDSFALRGRSGGLRYINRHVGRFRLSRDSSLQLRGTLTFHTDIVFAHRQHHDRHHYHRCDHGDSAQRGWLEPQAPDAVPKTLLCCGGGFCCLISGSIGYRIGTFHPGSVVLLHTKIISRVPEDGF